MTRPEGLITVFGTGSTRSSRTVDPALRARSVTNGTTASPLGLRSSGTRIRFAIIRSPFGQCRAEFGTEQPLDVGFKTNHAFVLRAIAGSASNVPANAGVSRLC